jgi:GTP-binding protein Era
MNERMMAATLAAIEGVDAIAVVTDATEPFGGGDRYLVGLLAGRREPQLLALNKIDLVKKESLLPIIERWSSAGRFDEVVPISAVTGDGVDILVRELVRRLPPGPPLFPPGVKTDASERFLAGEIVREQVLLRTRDEIPYTTTVLVEDLETAGDRVRITASILVERDSQKGILIGRGGAAIKAIGTAARKEIEAALGRPVFLALEVRVRPAWREDERLLDQLGLPR